MDRRVIKTRAAIRAAYFALLAENPTERISVSEIARRADIDRKTFYLHYATVEDISREYLTSCIDEFTANMREAGFFERPFYLEVAFLALNRMVERNRDFLRLLAGHEEGEYFWRKLKPIVVEQMVKTYGDKVKVGKEIFRVYCSFGVSGIMHLYVDHLCHPDQLTIEQVGKIATDIAYNGFTSLSILPKARILENRD